MIIVIHLHVHINLVNHHSLLSREKMGNMVTTLDTYLKYSIRLSFVVFPSRVQFDPTCQHLTYNFSENRLDCVTQICKIRNYEKFWRISHLWSSFLLKLQVRPQVRPSQAQVCSMRKAGFPYQYFRVTFLKFVIMWKI